MSRVHRVSWLIILCLHFWLGASAIGIASAQTPAALSQILTADDTRHLLVRTGIGAAPADVLALRNFTRQEAIDKLIAEFRPEPDVPLPAWVNAPVPHYHARQDMDDDARLRFNNDRDAELSQLRQWWLVNMLDTTSPQTERMVLFWHDIFATNYHDTDRQSLAIARQNQTFRQLGMGSWDALLKAMIRDPALLEFLDSGSNHKRSPNENLARELLELFILGEGNYKENDVREAARSLTGHDSERIHDLSFRLKSWAQDRRKKTLFGVTGKHDGNALIDLALQQPPAARFLVSRFWHAFVSDSAPDEAWVAHLAKRFRESDYAITELYRDVLESEAFWSDKNRGSMIKSPVDLIAGTARTLEFPKTHWRQMTRWQAELGMDLFAPPNVSGWKEGAAFITPGHLLNRFTMMDTLIADPLESANAGNAQDMSIPSQSASKQNKEMDASSPDMDMRSNKNTQGTGLQFRMAAEDYQGPVRYQVTLLNDQSLLWRSEELDFKGGHDTEMFGRIEDQSELSWQLETVAAPAHEIANSNRIMISYLNDAAGPGGDRNMYVDGVLIGDEWLPGSYAIQEGECVPQRAANAWKLYCDGSLTFTRSSDAIIDTDSLPAWRASAAHAQWIDENARNNSLTLYLTLDHLVTPHTRFHTLRFSVETMLAGTINLRMESFGCWPSCVSKWPACAWVDENFRAAKTLSYPWSAADDDRWKGDDGAACHLNEISQAERELVASLWRSLPGLIDAVKGSKRGKRYSKQLEVISTHLNARDVSLSQTPYGTQGSLIQISDDYTPKAQPRPPQSDPLIVVSDSDSILTQLRAEKLDFRSLLVPDITLEGLPALSVRENTPAAVQLKTIVKHPSFQVK